MEFESSADKMSDNLLALVSSVVAFQCSVILNSKMFMKIPPTHKILARIYCSLIYPKSNIGEKVDPTWARGVSLVKPLVTILLYKV